MCVELQRQLGRAVAGAGGHYLRMHPLPFNQSKDRGMAQSVKSQPVKSTSRCGRSKHSLAKGAAAGHSGHREFSLDNTHYRD
jgi:hypothetical protein